MDGQAQGGPRESAWHVFGAKGYLTDPNQGVTLLGVRLHTLRRAMVCQEVLRHESQMHRTDHFAGRAILQQPAFVFLCFVLIPITFGGLVYVLFRSTGLMVFDWIEMLGLLNETIAARSLVSNVRLPEWFLYSAPDGLWVLSITSWMILIWQGRPPLIWLSIGVVLGVGGELGQAVGVVPGTYQHLDILAYLLGFVAALPLFRRHHE